jgi:Zn-dependent protease/CBS domain-containing protein
MLRHDIPIGRLFGITIDLDYSWFLIAALLTWILAVSYYPSEFGGWNGAEYWLMGAITAVMLFVSVLIHELAHSLVAQRYGIPVPRITLFLFGGVSQIASEPPNAGTEFWIAAAGPVMSLALAALCWEIEPLVRGWEPLFALAEYLAVLNLILAVFNLIPGFPLDGGRVFRAFLWRITKNYHRATMAAAMAGRFFGFLMIFFGFWHLISGDMAGGLWIAFIGWFLESAAGGEMRQETFRHRLGNHRVADAMQRSIPHVPAGVTLDELAERTGLPGAGRWVIATTPDGSAGLVTPAAIRAVPHEAWPTTTVGQVMSPLKNVETTQPDEILWSVLEKMGREGVNQMPVLDSNGIVGMLGREDILHYLSVLEGFHGWKTLSSGHTESMERRNRK